jgi:hypothetical protein
VTGVSKDQRSSDLLSSSGVDINACRSSLHTVLEENTPTSAKNVGNNLSTLGVTADDELGLRASLVVSGDLGNPIGGTLVYGATVWSLDWVVVLNVLIITALETGADGIDELSLTSWVWLVVSLCEEDVGGRASGLALLETVNIGSEHQRRREKNS